MTALLHHSEELFGQALGRIPPGVYEGSFRIEDDGSGDGREYEVRVALHAQGDRIDVDMAGTSSQATGMINVAYSQAMAAIMFGIRACVGLSLPLDEGNYRRVTMNLPVRQPGQPSPPGRLQRAHRHRHRGPNHRGDHRRPVQGRSRSGHGPDRHRAHLHHGAERRRAPLGYLGVEMGVRGRAEGADGTDASSASMFGSGRSSTDVEPLEVRYPVLFERSGLWADSEGLTLAGRGAGTETVVRVQTDATVTVRTGTGCGWLRPAKGGQPGGAAGTPFAGPTARSTPCREIDERPPGSGVVDLMRTPPAGAAWAPRNVGPARPSPKTCAAGWSPPGGRHGTMATPLVGRGCRPRPTRPRMAKGRSRG